DPAKMIGGFLRRFADDRNVQATADCLGYLPGLYSLVDDTVIGGSSTTFLEHESVKMRSIEPMHRGPAIKTVANKCGNPLLTRDADQLWHKAVITAAVDRWRKAQHRCTNSASCQRKRCVFRLAGEVGIVYILFGCERALALSEQSPRGDDQRPIRGR